MVQSCLSHVSSDFHSLDFVFFTMGSLSVMSLVAMALPHMVFAIVFAERSESEDEEWQKMLRQMQDMLVPDKNGDASLEPSMQSIAKFIWQPDNQHCAEMLNSFTPSRLSTLGWMLLGCVLSYLFQKLVEPCMGKEEKPDDFDFMKKKWKFLTGEEKVTILNQPYKFLRLRYGINQTAGFLYPIIRLVFIHVLPATIVLRWGFNEMAADVWQLSVKAFFMTLYPIYLAGVIFVFINSMVSDQAGFAGFFLVPLIRLSSRYSDHPIKDLWNDRDRWAVPWLGGLLLWCTFGLELVLSFLTTNFFSKAGEVVWLGLLWTKWLFGLVCLIHCFTHPRLQFWNLTGALLGSMSFLGFWTHDLDYIIW